MLIVPHLAQEPWLKKGPKEHLQDEKLRGSYGVCFGLRFPPLSTEMTTACGFVCPLCTERRLYPVCHSIFSTHDFSDAWAASGVTGQGISGVFFMFFRAVGEEETS